MISVEQNIKNVWGKWWENFGNYVKRIRVWKVSQLADQIGDASPHLGPFR